MEERLILFDTTLRDGEQAPGFSMDRDEKLQVARALDRLAVDVVEAGFPAASPGDFEAVQAVARELEGPATAALCRCHRADIDRAADALCDAARPRLHTFLATSPLHREHKLGLDRGEVVARVSEGVSRARERCEDVEFSAEDASRTEREFLAEVVAAAIEAGASTINIPDTVGYALPNEFEALFRYLRSEVHGADRVTFSAHCHDDLGLAVANSLAAVRGGARQVEATLCGIGERAGNAALEEVAMAVRARPEFGVETAIHSEHLHAAVRVLEAVTGQPIPRNKAIVGGNAFSHEAGIHQHGVIAHRETYEILRPEDVGQRTALVLGKHSGRHAFRRRLESLGHAPDEARLEELFAAFKDLADCKRDVHDDDLQALVLGQRRGRAGPWASGLAFVDAINRAGTYGELPMASKQAEVNR